MSSNHFFYIFQCGDGTLYCGYTTDLAKREAEHVEGRGAKYTRSRKGGRVVYSEKFETRSGAMKREAEVKKWKREKKLGLLKKVKLSSST